MNKLSKTIGLFSKMAVAVAVVGCFVSCDKNEFSIKGKIDDAKNVSLVLERGENGHWISLDSVKTDDSGNFEIEFGAPDNPEIYRLRMGSQYVYVPIDSVEQISLETNIADFGIKYALRGSEQAEKMAKFESEANALTGDSVAIENFKKSVFTEIMQDAKGNILSYYVLNKTIGGEYLFNPENPKDAKYYAAVATAYKEFNPNDPRTKWLENKALELQRKRTGDKGKIAEVESVAFFEIDLKDCRGADRKLSDVMVAGKPTIVVFSLLTHPDSPVLNRELAKISDDNNKAVNIYQVCLDDDQLGWKQAAVNLPWTVVYDPDGVYSKSVLTYNVSSLPAFYVYDGNGELSASAVTISELKDALKKIR